MKTLGPHLQRTVGFPPWTYGVAIGRPCASDGSVHSAPSVLLDLTCNLLLSRGNVGQGPTTVGIEMFLRYLQHHKHSGPSSHRPSSLECFGRSMDTPSWDQLTSISKTQCVACTARSAFGHEGACRARIAGSSYSFVTLPMLSTNAGWSLIVSVGWRKSSFIGGRLSSLLEGNCADQFDTTWHFSHPRFAFPSNFWLGNMFHCLLSATPLFFEQFCNCQIVAENFRLAHCLGQLDDAAGH